MRENALPAPFSLVAFDRVDSTNDEAKRLAQAGAPPFTVVWAKSQDQGRGRLGRKWDSVPGNLYCSVLVDPGADLALAPQLSFVAAIAVADTLAELVPAAAIAVKWPNDVLADGAKICGMLLEWGGPLIVLGVGINVAAHPVPALYPATSLARLGSGAQPFDVLAAFSDHFGHWVERWKREGFSPIRAAWTARAAGLGQPGHVRLADGTTLDGKLYGLDAEGALLLDTPGGERRRIVAGDVFFAS